MANQLLMPKLGLTMEEGTLIEWYVKEGDSFEEGDIIFAVETEKLTNEVEANQSGEILEILVEEGETVAVKTPVANLVGYEGGAAESKEELSQAEPQKKEVSEEKKVKKEKKETSSDIKVMAAPKARKVASDNDISLEEVAAALAKSRLSVSDVEEYLAGEKDSGEDKKEAAKTTKKKQSSSMRKIIAERLSESWRSPHIYLRKEIDVDALICFKESLKAKGREVSLNDVITFVTAKAIKDSKTINTVEVGEGEFEVAEDINIGIAVAVEAGLLVPVVKNAEQYRVEELAAKSKDLIKRTKENKLTPDEMQGGTFTITNLGMFGIDEFTAILNPPQSAILAVGTIKEKLYFDSFDDLNEKRVINFTLGVDHRSIDGATAAKFMQTFAEYIENPYLCF
ncbi:2-oxo acid dehydrogenase subunit E2 [Halanaerobium sp. Z-7514]|uniref:Dihydrolipoamide acetyltransferase component of pyruvate dehydrogenase complex n=1 Tax=Halanaerobium polyolivorans TaxID=2886943 RepID=A0AAW4WU71_9FIRM|nr:dihydrolipoamide acetyltransferase family protein [Halanaerobium polyolivorans]MCC3144080.1 2-oxo acid dehydrogenase subunit E2 [Halanaerobium polyolivorans]RQD78258.1 MAG: 2-oxo acid dehydrogenase subunit E2 [Halanaerobium sp. MSAO_Bac5]